MPRITFRLPSILAVSLLCTIVRTAEIGVPHSAVIALDDGNFDDHLNDPANGLWLLKFYAPWCGHCKKLVPVLDAVAPFLAGKMSIGTVDCTVEKKLCKRHEVRGYPTLKYYRDGDFQDYPFGRDKDSIISFGEKMSDRAVKMVSTREEATAELLGRTPVAFVVHDPGSSGGDSSSSSAIDASGATAAEKDVEKAIQSTELTRAFGQVARRMQAGGASFGLLSPDAGPEEVSGFLPGGVATPGGFVARVEGDVPARLYGGGADADALAQWVEENVLAAVTELGGDNFRRVSRMGRALAIAVYDPDGDGAATGEFRREHREYAVHGEHRGEYVFAAMDGKRWAKFLKQFSVEKENLPEVFMIDVPGRIYWQNTSVAGVSEFITAVRSGDIQSREQEGRRPGAFDEFLQMFVNHMPWSLLAALALFVAVFWLAWPWMGGGDIVYPPPPVRAQREEEDPTGVKTSENNSDGSNKKDR